LNGKIDLIETATDSVADARPAIQNARSPRLYSRPDANILTAPPGVTLRLFSC
jgi:hypothetical protein